MFHSMPVHRLVVLIYDTYQSLDTFGPFSDEELNARIDEAEEEIERGEGKSFDEMMAGFRKELLWLK